MTVTPPAPQAEGQGPAISAEEPSAPYAAGPPILTEEQEHIVRWDGGPLMVLAGAGTGKTTVIVERVRHLLATEADLLPEHVLVLTYNVKAARELVERFERALGPEVAGRLWVQNFHSFGHRVLRDAAAEVGLPERVEVLDSVGQRLLLRELRPGLDLLYHDRGGDPYAQLGHFADLINRAKDELVTPAEYRDLAEERRRGFEARHGMGAYDQTIAGLRMRGDLRAARQVQRAFAAAAAGSLATAAATAAAAPAATRSKVATAAGREARREVRGDGYAGYWTDLDPQQRQLADGLQATFERDGEALDVRRLLEEAEVYAAYQEALAARGALDFGEQILRVIALFETRPNILRRYQRQFRHILVDEFQDANMAQILLLELLGRSPDRPDQVVVVGDDDQSIYRFRGASYAAFRQFKDRFERPPAWDPQRTTTRIGTVETRDLLRNRRSTGHILTAATRLIEKNAGRLKEGRRLRTERPDGGPVELVYAGDPADQATAVVDWIQQVAATLPPRLELPDGSSRPRRWSDIAVLYRKHQHREAIVERLREAGIPAVVTGGIGLFVQPEIRDLEAALRVLVDPEDSVSFTRLLSAGPWRLDAAEILRLTRAAAHDRRPVSEAAREIRRAGELLVDVVEEVGDDGLGTQEAPAEPPHRHRLERLDDLLRAKLERLLDCLDALAPRANREGPFTLLDEYLVRTSILRDLLAVGTTEAQRTVLAVARLLRFTAGWQREHPLGSLADFIAYLDIYQQVGGDPDVEPGGQVEVEGVQLMTVYQAKGLEFEAVVVPWLTEGQFPDERKEQLLIPVELLKQTPPDEFVVAEERRLGYVAMTRARSRLLLVAVDGVRERPSRFAEEIAPGGRGAARIPGPTASDGGVPAEGSPTEAVLATSARYRVAHRGDVTVIDRAADEAEQGSLQREPPPLAADADAIAARTEARLERLLPVPAAFERRFALRRRAVELIGALEQLAGEDDAARARLLDELVGVAADAAHAAEADRAAGLDPVTLAVVAGHDPAGGSLLQLAPLPYAFSHSQFWAYRTCPLQWTFQRLYRIPARDERTYFTFGSAIHEAFERFSQARRDATAAGEPLPGFETLEAAFRETWDPRAFPDVTTAEGYRARSAPILRRFYDRELTRESELLLFESPFVFDLPAGEGEPSVRINGVIDRVDRLPDGSIELIDYKTGQAKSQADVDRDDQLTLYALALRSGVLADPATGASLPPASRLTLYFTEADLWLSTTRTDEQLDACAAGLVELARRIRAGDFAATPGYDACRRCDYARLCPSRYNG